MTYASNPIKNYTYLIRQHFILDQLFYITVLKHHFEFLQFLLDFLHQKLK